MSLIVGEPTLISVAQSRAFQLIGEEGMESGRGGLAATSSLKRTSGAVLPDVTCWRRIPMFCK
jgi:hypothetical protein